ncbi:MAG: glycoside hydrolase family 30 protein, partial [Motilibacteraceae bacterium]
HGGQLDVADEDAYARYLTRAVADYRAAGVPVVALTPVNEPLYATADYPSTWMGPDQQARLVGEHLRPALDAAGLQDVGVLGYDHNWDDSWNGVDYPMSLVTGPYAAAFAGTAFHCYAGDVSAQSQVLAAAPDKQVWTTECSGGTWATDFGGNLGWGAKNMLVGAFRNGSTASLWWNLALDPNGGPTDGGCTTCRGVLTVDPASGQVTRNVEWYLLAHVGRYVVPGAHVVGSTAATPGGVLSVAFRNPDGSHALVLSNDTASARTVVVRWAGHAASLTVPARSLSTARW